MAGLLRSYVHYFHRRSGFVGHLWQGRFQSPAVAVAEYFLSGACYIERNPVAKEKEKSAPAAFFFLPFSFCLFPLTMAPGREPLLFTFRFHIGG